MRSLILDPVVLAQPLGQQKEGTVEQQGNEGSHRPKTSEEDRKRRMLETATTPDEKIKALEDFSELSDISPVGELYEVFKFNSQYTDIQRENRLASLKGKVVNWDCTVYEVSKTGDRRYLINSTPGDGRVGLILNVIARNEAEARYIENLMTGSPLTFIGMLNGEMFMRSLILDPVVLAQPFGQQAAERQGGDGTHSPQLSEEEKKGRVLKTVKITAVYVGENEYDPEFDSYIFRDADGVEFKLIGSYEDASKLAPYRGRMLNITYTIETFYYEGGENMAQGEFLQHFEPAP